MDIIGWKHIDMNNYFKITSTIGGRYFFVAGLAFLFFYVLYKNKFIRTKIQKRFPANQDYIREIFYSVITIAIFGFIPVIFIFNEDVSKYTQLYKKLD